MENYNYYNGYKVVKVENKNFKYLDDFPEFPNNDIRSKTTFQDVERVILEEKNIKFPIKFNITERIVKMNIDNEEYFSLTGIKNLIYKDLHLFRNTTTCLKIRIDYEEDKPILKIIYYTIDNDNGLNSCLSLEKFLNFIFINYDLKLWTEKRVDYLENVVKLNFKEIKQIPIFPVQWLDFDEDGNLIEFPNIICLD